MPVVLYNSPGFTGVEIEPETAAELAQHDNIIGMKDSGPSVSQLLFLLVLN